MNNGSNFKESQLVKIENGNISNELVFMTIHKNKGLTEDELNELSSVYNIPVSHTEIDNNCKDKAYVLFLDEFEFGQVRENVFLLLTADDSFENIKKKGDITHVNNFLIYVKDFKDGRTFSLIRQIRKENQSAQIFVGGLFGLDQANYYTKSGATGFFVQDEQLQTILKTLKDLKSGHSGQSVGVLPMFQ